MLIEKVEFLQKKIREIEKKVKALTKEIEEARLLKTIPGVGPLASALIISEAKKIERFEKESKFSAYAGASPTRFKSCLSKEKMVKRRYFNRRLKAFLFPDLFYCHKNR